MTPPDLSLVLPCFNEATHLRASAAELSSVLERSGLRYEIVFVDDCSRDGTRALLPDICGAIPHARFLLHDRNLGRGGAFKTGFRATQGRVTGFIDVDLEVPARYIPEAVREIIHRGADIATGRRQYQLQQAGALHRVALSRGYHAISRALLGVRVKDSEAGFKFFNRATTAELISATQSDGWFFDTEVIVLAERAGLSIREVPVPFLRREDKASTVRIARDVGHYVIELHRLRRRLRAGFRVPG